MEFSRPQITQASGRRRISRWKKLSSMSSFLDYRLSRSHRQHRPQQATGDSQQNIDISFLFLLSDSAKEWNHVGLFSTSCFS